MPTPSPGVVRILLLTLLLSLSSTLAVPGEAAVLHLGSISDKPGKEINRFRPLADYLTKHLSELGIDSVETVVAGDVETMAAHLSGGVVDLYIDSPFPTLAVSNLSGSRVILRRWKKEVGTYRSVIFVRTDSDIQSVADLYGRTIVFEEAFSTSSYFVPKASLISEGLTLVEKSRHDSEVAPNEVAYVFSDDDRNSLAWVWRKRVAAGAFNDITFNALPPKYKNHLRIIHRSIEVPRHLVSIRPGFEQALADRLRQLLLDMEKTETGRATLRAFENTRRFDELPGGTEAALEPLIALGNVIADELGFQPR